MLVLTRRPGEAIRIGDDIELSVISVKGDQVKLGINAPKHIDIHRKEVFLSIQEENHSALADVGDIFSLLSNKK